MQYLLDTNACIALLNRTSRVLDRRVRDRAPDEIGLPAPVLYELYYGAFKSQRRKHNVDLLDRLAFEIVPFDGGDARSAGEIRSRLERAGQPIGPYDLLIAGQAKARELVLITANTREFERVAGLRFEDWSLSN